MLITKYSSITSDCLQYLQFIVYTSRVFLYTLTKTWISVSVYTLVLNAIPSKLAAHLFHDPKRLLQLQV